MNEKFYIDQQLISNDQSQLQAYNSKGNTVVVAGPGSGKTRILTLKAIKLIQSEIHPPKGLACISYSRETVRELKKRLKEYGYRSSNYDFIGTMHGFCLIHILQPFAHLFPQYNVPVPLKIASEELTEQIYNGVLYELNIDTNLLTKTNLNRQRSLSFSGSSEVEIQTNIFEVQAANLYEQRLIISGHVDFISMVNIASKMIREQTYIKQTLEAKFPWLLIDEYQDLGKALHEMVLELWAQTEIKIFAVGDMNQCIYGFNGAYPDFLQEVNNKDDFESIPLTSNYRSNQDIIEASLDTLKLEPPRPEYSAKKRINENAEFTFIVCESEIHEQCQIVAQKVIPKLFNKNIKYNEIGILVGSSSQVIQMAKALKDQNIPFYIVKWDFINSDVVYWLQDCAQWCIDNTHKSFDDLFRFWQLQIQLHKDYRSNWETIQQRVSFHKTLTESKTKTTVISWLNYIIEELEIKKLLMNSDRYPDENNNLDKLLDEAENRNLKDASLRRFAFLGEPENEVTITTRHSAKGLEFEAVVMLGMEEGNFPYTYQVNERQMQEYHRVCYVCVSRAKRECILLRSKRHTLQTRNGPWTKTFLPSRFWNKLLERFDNGNNIVNAREY